MARDPFFKSKAKSILGNTAIALLAVLLPLILITANSLLMVYDKDAYSMGANEAYLYLTGKSEGIANLTEREQLHMLDVKNLVNSFFVVLYAALLIALFAIIYLVAVGEWHRIGLGIVWGSCLLLLFLIASAVIGYFNFESLFVKFHEIFFSNDYWLLPSGSRLISLFPQTFFYETAKKIALRTAIAGIVLLCIGYLIRYNPTRRLPGGE